MTRFLKLPQLTALLICGSLSSISVQSLAATLKISENLLVTEVNDSVVDNGFIGQKSTFELGQGNHALIVHYKDVFEDVDLGEDRLIKSDDFVVKFTITDQKQLKLSTEEVKNLAAAEKFSASPKLKLQDNYNNQLNVTLEQVSDYKIAKQVDIAVSTLALKQTAQSNNSALPVSTSVAASTSKTSVVSVSSLTMLQYWWQNASNEEKQRFLQYTK